MRFAILLLVCSIFPPLARSANIRYDIVPVDIDNEVRDGAAFCHVDAGYIETDGTIGLIDVEIHVVNYRIEMSHCEPHRNPLVFDGPFVGPAEWDATLTRRDTIVGRLVATPTALSLPLDIDPQPLQLESPFLHPGFDHAEGVQLTHALIFPDISAGTHQLFYFNDLASNRTSTSIQFNYNVPSLDDGGIEFSVNPQSPLIVALVPEPTGWGPVNPALVGLLVLWRMRSAIRQREVIHHRQPTYPR